MRTVNSLDHDAHFWCIGDDCPDDCPDCPDSPTRSPDSPPLSPGWAKIKSSRVGLTAKVVHVLQEGVEQKNRSKLWLRVVMVVVVGCAAVVPAECIVKADPEGMKMITFSNFLFAIGSNLHGLWDRKIPMRNHAALVAANYGYNHFQSLSFTLGLPMTIALVVKVRCCLSMARALCAVVARALCAVAIHWLLSAAVYLVLSLCCLSFVTHMYANLCPCLLQNVC